MADPTAADLQARLDEVDAQLTEMVGAPNFSLGQLTVDESKMYADLSAERVSLRFRIATLAAGGNAHDNARGSTISPSW